MTNDEIRKLVKIWRSNANYEGKYPPPYTLMSVQLNNACDLIEEYLDALKWANLVISLVPKGIREGNQVRRDAYLMYLASLDKIQK